MALGVDETLREIDEIHRRYPVYHHPLFSEIVEGTLSREQLKEKVRQEGIIPLHNHNYHGRLYVICPNPKWRSRIAEVCYEEGSGKLYAGGVPHSELYLRLGAAVGASREEMMNTAYCSGALGFRSYFTEICGRNFLEGVSAHMLASEAPVPEYSRSQADALKEHYGLTDEDVKFCSVHEVADTDHANVGRELLTEFASTEKDFRLVLKTVEDTVKLMILMHDDIYRCVKGVR
jgi:pyrroloquinoline quinone (PQQ) biosynthesis protein C